MALETIKCKSFTIEVNVLKEEQNAKLEHDDALAP